MANSRSASDRRTTGFTLIEILVALMIVAIALTALVTEAGQHVSATVHMRDRTLAHWVAMNRVTERLATNEWPEIGDSDGTEEMAGREWFWEMTVSETPNDEIRRIDVEVRSRRDRENPEATLISYMRRPAQ